MKEKLHTKKKYGLVICDPRKSSIGTLNGCKIEILKEFTSIILNKQKQGGQSQARFNRLQDESRKKFYDKLATEINRIFLPIIKRIEIIYIGGSFITKDALLKSKSFHYEILKKIGKTVNVGSNSYSGLRELVYKLEDELKSQEFIQQRKLVMSFLDLILKDSTLISYGKRNVMELIDQKNCKLLLVSENSVKKYAAVIETAELKGIKIELISNQVEEGMSFEKIFDGLGCFCYF